MQTIAQNWQIVFGGIAAIVAATIAAWLKYRFDRRLDASKAKSSPTQNIQAGSGSTNYQAGGNITTGKR
jgi:hypothetical protein